MKRLITCALIFLYIVGLLGAPQPAAAQVGVPSFTIVSVTPDVNVTIRTYNFPARDTFEVRMGYIGARATDGILAGSIASGTGGSFTVTLPIPAALKGVYQVAIRAQSPVSGYFAYNWFYNNPASANASGSAPAGAPSIPTFSIVRVIQNEQVMIQARGFPANILLQASMGHVGNASGTGLPVTTLNSGDGSFKTALAIPPGLKGSYQLAIRLQSIAGGNVAAYNWFYNRNSDPEPTPVFGQVDQPQAGFPSLRILSVQKNTAITIQTEYLPANETYEVWMGPMGTRGIRGYYVSSVTSQNAQQPLTFPIPAELRGSYQISIRLQSKSGYYAYNWFYNTNTP